MPEVAQQGTEEPGVPDSSMVPSSAPRFPPHNTSQRKAQSTPFTLGVRGGALRLTEKPLGAVPPVLVAKPPFRVYTASSLLLLP